MSEVTAIEISLEVPTHHPCFAGHFPGNPIVPGALLLQWIADHIARCLDGARLIEIQSMKFTASLKPGDSCKVELLPKGRGGKFNLHCYADTGTVCKAVLVLQEKGC